MTTSIDTGIHFNEGDVSHRWYPGDDKCGPYGALKIGRPFGATLYFHTPQLIDKVIAELTAIRAQMLAGSGAEPVDAPLCGEFLEDDRNIYYCDREHGHPGSCHAETGDGGEICWSSATPVADACPAWDDTDDGIYYCVLAADGHTRHRDAAGNTWDDASVTA